MQPVKFSIVLNLKVFIFREKSLQRRCDLEENQPYNLAYVKENYLYFGRLETVGAGQLVRRPQLRNLRQFHHSRLPVATHTSAGTRDEQLKILSTRVSYV